MVSLGLKMKQRYNFSKVIYVFKKNYKLIPLERFNKNPYKILVSTILSSRTKDEITLKASRRLFSKAKNINELSQLAQSEIRNLIYPVGFYKTKTRYLKILAEKINADYKGLIPEID